MLSLPECNSVYLKPSMPWIGFLCVYVCVLIYRLSTYIINCFLKPLVLEWDIVQKLWKTKSYLNSSIDAVEPPCKCPGQKPGCWYHLNTQPSQLDKVKSCFVLQSSSLSSLLELRTTQSE